MKLVDYPVPLGAVNLGLHSSVKEGCGFLHVLIGRFVTWWDTTTKRIYPKISNH